MMQTYINFRLRYFLQLVCFVVLTVQNINAHSDYIELDNSFNIGCELVGENLSVGSDAPIIISEGNSTLDLKEGIWRSTLRHGDGNGFFYAVDPPNIEDDFLGSYSGSEFRAVGDIEWSSDGIVTGLSALEVLWSDAGDTHDLNFEWYLDSDKDSFGDYDAEPILTITDSPPPSAGYEVYVKINRDTCPDDHSEDNHGCPVQITPPIVQNPAPLYIDNYAEGYVIVAHNISRGEPEATLVILDSTREVELPQGIWRFSYMRGDGYGNFYYVNVLDTENMEWGVKTRTRLDSNSEWDTEFNPFYVTAIETLWLELGDYVGGLELNATLLDSGISQYFSTDIRVVEGETYAWYPDSDDDGFGDFDTEPEITFSDNPPYEDSNYSKNNLDHCPYVPYVVNNGCPIDYDINWTSSQAYDINGNLKSSSKAYFDDLGKGIQTQTTDISTGRTWATQTLYDSQGRPAVQTLSAPVRESGSFVYAPNFFTDHHNNKYSTSNFESNPESPTKAGKGTNTVGRYYSTNNTTQANTQDDHRLKGNSYQDITDYPFSRTIYSELNPGSVLRVVGGNKTVDTNNDGDVNDNEDTWHQSYTFSMPAGQELSQTVAFNHNSYNVNITSNRKIIKTVSRDVHGREAVMFSDTDGKTLAAARVGGSVIRDTDIAIRAQGFVDVHVPDQTQGFTIDGVSGITTEVYNLITEAKETGSTTALSPGFYRVSITNLENYNPTDNNNTVIVECKENYYDYSLNEYDEVGRLIASYQPVGNTKAQKPVSTFEYNALGQLTQNHSPDEGDAWFLYRKDGQIRFSTNSKQWANKQFSYTNYDELGRPVESGVYTDASNTYVQAFYISPEASNNTTDPFKTALKNLVDNVDGLNDTNCSEVQETTYDVLEASDISALSGVHADYGNPSFLAGNVAKTHNDNTTTWYSYDIYSRVKWIVQKIPDLGTGAQNFKTIDYKYDPITGAVLEVDYQRHEASEHFVHRYTYDSIDDSLIKVETSLTGNPNDFTPQADYGYYETGALKQVKLAPHISTNAPLQTIDYVYNLNGQLKAINPGSDANDLFSMQIDYHGHDYTRSVTGINTPNYGQDQFNGNIKGIRWNNKNIENNNAVPQQTYSYYYNKNNWLTDAVYGQYANSNENATKINVQVGGTHEDVSKSFEATNSITLLPGFYAMPGPGQVIEAKIVGGTSSNFQTGDYNVFDITYDANGNIQTLNRNKKTEGNKNEMDQLNYVYNPAKPNQLQRVEDTAGQVLAGKDLENQTGTNYTYNAIGQLVRNNKENITYIYNASGLVTEVKQGGYTRVKFFYNDKGHRVKKESYVANTNNLSYTEHYVRDAAGTALAIYRNNDVKEHTIYGASRLGVFNRTGNTTGNAVYQLTDHLGNVRAVAQWNGTNAEAIVATDYYPFGMPMPGRDNGPNSYRYKYQGQEKDPETGKEAFELRLWDSRIGRWLTTDPAGQFHSPYLGMGNNPINGIDPDGGVFNPVYGTDGVRRGSTVEGNAGDAIIFDGDFAGKTADEVIQKGGFFLKDNMDFASSLAGINVYADWLSLPDRPDYDGKLTRAEAYRWFSQGNGQALYVDASKIDFSNLSTNDFKKNNPAVINFFPIKPNNLWDKYNNNTNLETGPIYGKITIELLSPNSGEIRILNDKGHFDTFDFNRILEPVADSFYTGEGTDYRLNCFQCNSQVRIPIPRNNRGRPINR